MKKQGGFIPGVRPGKSTADFIDNIYQKLLYQTSVFLGFIAVLPNIIARFSNGGIDINTTNFWWNKYFNFSWCCIGYFATNRIAIINAKL